MVNIEYFCPINNWIEFVHSDICHHNNFNNVRSTINVIDDRIPYTLYFYSATFHSPNEQREIGPRIINSVFLIWVSGKVNNKIIIDYISAIPICRQILIPLIDFFIHCALNWKNKTTTFCSQDECANEFMSYDDIHICSCNVIIKRNM